MSKLEQARQILIDAIDQHQPDYIFGLLSGGHDSLTVTHFCDSVRKLDASIHIDTGIGIPETQQFVIDVCKRYEWPLKIYRAVDNTKADGTPDPMIYRDIVLANGFPGADAHRFMYIKLKERQVHRVCREHPGKVMFISGVRKAESARRMGTAKEVQVRGNQIWVAPFLHMDTDDLETYQTANQLPSNPVKKLLCMSGECLCGAYAKKGELGEIDIFFPEVGKHIRAIQDEVRAAGFPWGWEDQPPAWWGKRKQAERAGQVDAFQEEAEAEIQMLCTSCEYKYEEGEQKPVIRRIA